MTTLPGPQDRPRTNNRVWLAAIAVVAVITSLFVATLTVAGPQRSDQAAVSEARTAGDTATLAPGLSRRPEGDPLAVGRPDAPVVLVEFADFRCPFCGLWARQTRPALQPFVDDGTLRIEYRDLVVFGAESERLAVAARAAGEQGRFWEYWTAVYQVAPTGGHPSYDQDDLVGFATKAGVPDRDRFIADLSKPELAARVAEDTAIGRRLGLTSVPSFLVGDTPVIGAQPTEVFVQAIRRQAGQTPQNGQPSQSGQAAPTGQAPSTGQAG